MPSAASSRVAIGKPSLSYTTNSRSGESSVDIQYLGGNEDWEVDLVLAI